MSQLQSSLEFFINLAKVQSVMTRRFDGRIGHGLGFSEFIILYHLSLAPEEMMRRVDLANKLGLTASGITRILAPMEKIGLIKREANAADARVSLVSLAPGGKLFLSESMGRAEEVAQDVLPGAKAKKIDSLNTMLQELSGIL